MNKIKIVFYNNFHVGDTFLSQPFIKNIIDNNKDNFEYYYYCHYNYFIYSSILDNIQNVNLLDKNNIIKVKCNFIDNEHNSNNPFYFDNNILIINTWIGKMFCNGCQECNLLTYIQCYKILLNNIYNLYNIKILFDDNIEQVIPIFPKNLNIENFIKFKENNSKKKIIFLRNYFPQSGQQFILNSNSEYIKIIKFLLSNNIVILSEFNNDLLNYKLENNINDLYFVNEYFNLPITETCENLYYMEKISHYCDISIHFDSGRSFLYLNDEFINDYKLGLKRSLKVHFSHTDYYYKALNQNKLVPPNYVMFCFANNYNDIINCLSSNCLSKI